MSFARALLPCLAVSILLHAACGAPPDKEIQQALGAIDAARAAGAEQYAHEELTAAEVAVDRAHEAVALGDLRLALNHALDGRERARNAARMAADGKAAARVEADHALTTLADALTDAQARLRVAESAGAPARVIETSRSVIMNGERSLQEARAAFDKDDYAAVVELDRTYTPILAAADKELFEAAPPRQ